ncbi:putative damage-inducible protein DinB (forms a four-helix bundle) [Abditibacterium utsteinense]|uniref:Putative damage-inducible protein DinB (Forms a four-helix bundle) n=1 Tax=Abditibacterium utsteinense TaxID=1960156 RepID=A0A2S8SVZ4_9BACT|nr:DinB family protein [Abditibacterium utsteinense]PQV64964.1 putative damage-inducible protein DinB (forms a four-helix bundle) [Abditibacterium utsteinense]
MPNPTFDATRIYVQMARYNTWMNEKLLAECSKTSDEQRKTERSVPFHSLHGLWNHLLLTNKSWLGRFNNQPFPMKSLDEILFEDWDELQAEHARTDALIASFAATLTPEILDSTLKFVRMGEARELPYFLAVSHLFNHQTHHRGQITAVMEQIGLDCGVTDLGAMPMMIGLG